MKRKPSYLFRHFGKATGTKGRHLLSRLDKGDISTLVRRVLEGISWFEANGLEDWRPKVAFCNIMSCSTCALALATGLSYSDAARKYKLDLDNLISYGFHPGGPCNKTEVFGSLVTLLWRTAAAH